MVLRFHIKSVQYPVLLSYVTSTFLWIFIARQIISWASVYRSQIVNFWKEFVTRTNFFYAEKIDGQWKFIKRNYNRASVYRSQIVSFKKEFVARTNFFYAERLTGNENSLSALLYTFIKQQKRISKTRLHKQVSSGTVSA